MTRHIHSSPRYSVAIWAILAAVALTAASPSCRNPQQYKTGWKFAKPYVDDLFKFVRTSSKAATNPASRYVYSAEEVHAATIVFKHQMPIFNSGGQVISHSFKESQLQAIQGVYRQDFYVVLMRTIQMLNKRKIYFTQLNQEIKAIVQASDDFAANSINYNAATGELVISSISHHTKINFAAIVSDIAVLSGGYYTYKGAQQ